MQTETPVPPTAVTWFEIAVTDFHRAVDFYETLLNVELVPERMDGMSFAKFPAAEGGVTGCLMEADHLVPGGASTIVYLSTPDIEAALARAATAGGATVAPKTALPGDLGYFAILKDSEGSLVGLHQAG